MPIRVTCPSCHKTLQAPDAAAGKKVRCPACKAVMAVPAPAAAPVESEPLLDPEPAAPEPSPLADALAAQSKPAAQEEESDSGAYGLAAPPPEPGGGEASDERRRPCPMCGEMIATTAMKCRFCGEVFDATLKRTGAASPSGVTPSSTNSKAIWALITGILGIFCCQPVLGPTAIILGVNARQEIDSMRGAQGGTGMAIAGIILGILDLIIFALAVVVRIAGITP